MSTAPSAGILDDRPMTAMQVVVVIVCFLTNMADGVDTTNLAFVQTVLSHELGIRPGMMGMVFGATGLGLAAGALLVAPLADKVGRRRIMLVTLAVLSISLLLTSRISNVHELAALRFVTGTALGTMIVCLNVTTAEFSNARWRGISVSTLHTGFTVGIMLSGGFVAILLGPHGWRSVFVAAGLLNALTFVLTFLFIPESPSFLVGRQPANALARLNAVLRRLGQQAVDSLPPVASRAGRGPGPLALLTPDIRRGTLLIWLAQFAFAIVGYLLLSWKPTVMVAAGLTPQQASLSAFVVGGFGIAGHAVMGGLARALGATRLTAIFLGLLSASLLIFGLQPPSVAGLIFTSGWTSFFNVGVYSGLFLVTLGFYPPSLRTTGVGVLVAWARIGGIAGPVLGGLMLELGVGRGAMFAVLAIIALVPMVALLAARSQVEEAPAPG